MKLETKINTNNAFYCTNWVKHFVTDAQRPVRDIGGLATYSKPQGEQSNKLNNAKFILKYISWSGIKVIK
jgi:hypothetical protein